MTNTSRPVIEVEMVDFGFPDFSEILRFLLGFRILKTPKSNCNVLSQIKEFRAETFAINRPRDP